MIQSGCKDNDVSKLAPRSRSKRGLLMIFVAIMIVAATTIVATSVDLGRLAYTKQSQSERLAKWEYCVDSAKALVVEDLINSKAVSQDFTITINKVALRIRSELSDSWGAGNGCKITVSGTIDGNPQSSVLYVGKRATPNPLQFGCFVTSTLDLSSGSSSLRINGDLYAPKDTVGNNIDLRGGAYCPLKNQPTFDNFTGSYIGRQPGLSISLDDAKYQAVSDVATSGTLTLKDPTNSGNGSFSKLFYHTGTLTITGNVVGEVTVYVTGKAIISQPQLTNGARLVVIVNGDVAYSTGGSDINLITSGTFKLVGNGSSNINGSLACASFSPLGSKLTIDFDDHFVTTPTDGARFRVPGQW